jgi:hypothetical protein
MRFELGTLAVPGFLNGEPGLARVRLCRRRARTSSGSTILTS